MRTEPQSELCVLPFASQGLPHNSLSHRENTKGLNTAANKNECDFATVVGILTQIKSIH